MCWPTASVVGQEIREYEWLHENNIFKTNNIIIIIIVKTSYLYMLGCSPPIRKVAGSNPNQIRTKYLTL